MSNTPQDPRIAEQIRQQRRQQDMMRKQQEAHAAAAGAARAGAASMGLSENLGQPMDFSGGIELGEHAHMYGGPPPLPGPGHTTPAEHPPGMAGFIPPNAIPGFDPRKHIIPPEGLPDDHDQLVGPGIAGGPGNSYQPPQQPAHPQVTQRRAPPRIPIQQGVRYEHPILQRLKQDLGIKKLDVKDVTVGGHVWGMVVLSQQELGLALRMADTLSKSRTEFELKKRTAIVSMSILEIDGVPAWEVMGLELLPGMVVSDPRMPPDDVRRVATMRLFDWIDEGSKTGLGSALYEKYIEVVDKSGSVDGDVDAQKTQYRCPVEGCDHELIIVPRYDINTKEQLPVFCQFHGDEMYVSSVIAEVTSPLA